MDLGLKGKIALVTGSSRGLGFATARQLANEGAHVAINGRTSDSVTQAARKIADGLDFSIRSPAADHRLHGRCHFA